MHDIKGKSSAFDDFSYVSDRQDRPFSALYLPYSNFKFPSIIINNDLTVSVWIFLLGYDAKPQSQRLVFLSGGPSQISFGLTYEPDSPVLYFWDGSFMHTSSSSLTLNKWQHLAYVQNERKFKLYLDGEIVYQKESPNLIKKGTYTDAWVGNINGYIDDLKIYKTALSQSDLLKEQKNFL